MKKVKMMSVALVGSLAILTAGYGGPIGEKVESVFQVQEASAMSNEAKVTVG